MASLKQLSDVDLKLLRIFCEVVQQGSFASAQVRLNLSQSAMSEYLKTLELRLGMRLCNRGPGGFKLLKEGEEVYHAARRLFEAVDNFKSEVQIIDQGLSGELLLLIQDEIINNPSCRVQQAIEDFTAEAGRRVRLNVEVVQGFHLVGHVAEGRAHLGIGLQHVKVKKLLFEPLFQEKMSLYCASNHPLFDLPDEALTDDRIEQYPYSSRGHLVPKDFSTLEQATNGADIAHGAQAHALLVLSGRDLGLLPDHFAAPFVERGRLRAIRPGTIGLQQDLGVLVLREKAKNKVVTRLLAHLLRAHGRQTSLSDLLGGGGEDGARASAVN